MAWGVYRMDSFTILPSSVQYIGLDSVKNLQL